MIEGLANRRSPYIDVEVAQRLLKALDLIALGLLTLITTVGIARFAPERDNDSLIGFFSLELCCSACSPCAVSAFTRSRHCATASSPSHFQSPQGGGGSDRCL